MKIIVSPTKSLDFESVPTVATYSQPRFLKDSQKLNKVLKEMSAMDLSKLMKISQDLATLNYQRNQDWYLDFTKDNAKQAVFSFTGEVFRSIDVNSMTEAQITKMQEQLRILSGLYGLLKPLDLIQPYRLEMGTKLQVGDTDTLYKFWGNKLAESLNEEMKDDSLLINLASAEYFRALPKKVLKVPMITPVFKDFKNGQYKTIMTYAKKARGHMVRYIIENDVTSINGLKGFDTGGYGFSEEMSQGNDLVFTR